LVRASPVASGCAAEVLMRMDLIPNLMLD